MTGGLNGSRKGEPLEVVRRAGGPEQESLNVAAAVGGQLAQLAFILDAGGRNQAVVRMSPAHQGLRAGDPAVGKGEGRLVVDLELAVVERPPQVPLEKLQRPV